jgi:hypothetical protein
MRVADRVTDVTDRMQTRRLESKRDSLDRDNERLRTELRSTRHELARERTARDELFDALKRNADGTTTKADTKVKTKRRGGFLRLLIVGGGAYVLGTRAGRERYDQLKGWASGMKDRVRTDAATEDDWTTMANGGAGGATSGMSGATGSSTGVGSTSTGSPPTGSTSTGSTSTGSTSTGSTTKRSGSSSTS